MLILNLTDRHLRPRTDTRFQTGLSHYAWLSRKFLHSILLFSFFFSLLFTLPVFYLSVLSAGNWAVDLDASVPEGEKFPLTLEKKKWSHVSSTEGTGGTGLLRVARRVRASSAKQGSKRSFKERTGKRGTTAGRMSGSEPPQSQQNFEKVWSIWAQ